MNKRFLAFLGATAFFVPASAVSGPSAAASTMVQSGRSLIGGGARRAEMLDFRNRFGQAIDGIRARLEERLLALDLSDPAMVTEFLGRQEQIEAWDAMAAALPQLPDDQLAATRTALSTALKGLSRIGELQQRINSKASGSSVGASACADRAYHNGQFGGGVIFLESWEDLIETLMGIYKPAELIPILARLPAPVGNLPYSDGPEGEREVKEAQAVLEFYSEQMPRISVADANSPVGVPLRTIEVPNPLKLMFDTAVHLNRIEVIRAEFMNDDFEACEREALAVMVADLTADVQALQTGVHEIKPILQDFRTETGTGLVNVRTDIGNFRTETGTNFGIVRTQIDDRAVRLRDLVNARANELQLRHNSAEGLLLLILDEVD